MSVLDTTHDPEQAVEAMRRREWLRERMRVVLTTEQRMLLSARLLGASLQECGEIIGVGRECARRIVLTAQLRVRPGSYRMDLGHLPEFAQCPRCGFLASPNSHDVFRVCFNGCES